MTEKASSKKAKLPAKPGALRLLEAYFLEHVGEVLDNKTLRKVADADSWSRRVRELRDKYGYDIKTRTEDPDLKVGQYVLVSKTKRSVPKKGAISKTLRYQVFDRDDSTCQKCGYMTGQMHEDGKPVRLHVAHVSDESHGGETELGNLTTHCSICNEGASNVSAPPYNWSRLMAVLRKAKPKDQEAAYEWLKNKLKK
jgi:hypothetical protein